MKILALEFSSDHRSVAVVNGSPEEPAALCGQATETGGQGARLMRLVEGALLEAHLERDQIEAIAIGLGPGSYAGIRSAIALGQGWQLGRGVQLIGISSVECLLAEARAQHWEGPVDFLIDAHRNEFYCARYELTAGEARLIASLKIITMAEA